MRIQATDIIYPPTSNSSSIICVRNHTLAKQRNSQRNEVEHQSQP